MTVAGPVMTPVVEHAPLLDELFGTSPVVFGNDLPGYRNHCYRVLNLALALAPSGADTRAKIEIAAYFHDLGIWSDGTFDYLGPSAIRAKAYLRENDRAAWSADVEAMIARHHQVTRAGPSGSLVEAFRRADWADVSLGTLRLGLASPFVADVKRAFPNAGFHRRLVQLTLERARRHPLSPLPMLRW